MFDDIGCLAGQQVQESERVLIRSLRFPVMRREHTDRFSRTRNQGRGLDCSHTSLQQHFESSADENWALLHIFDNDAFSLFKRYAARALTFRQVVPEIDPRLRKSALGNDPKRQ